METESEMSELERKEYKLNPSYSNTTSFLVEGDFLINLSSLELLLI